MNYILAIIVFFAGASSGWWLPNMLPTLSSDALLILSMILGALGGYFAMSLWLD